MFSRKRAAVIALGALAILAISASNAKAAKPYGALSSVDEEAMTLTLKPKDGEEMTIQLKDKTRYFKRWYAKLSDAPVGDMVVVVGAPNDDGERFNAASINAYSWIKDSKKEELTDRIARGRLLEEDGKMYVEVKGEKIPLHPTKKCRVKHYQRSSFEEMLSMRSKIRGISARGQEQDGQFTANRIYYFVPPPK